MSTEATLTIIAAIVKLTELLSKLALNLNDLQTGKEVSDEDLSRIQAELDEVVSKWKEALSQRIGKTGE